MVKDHTSWQGYPVQEHHTYAHAGSFNGGNSLNSVDYYACMYRIAGKLCKAQSISVKIQFFSPEVLSTISANDKSS